MGTRRGVALRPTRGEGPSRSSTPDHTEPIHLVNQRRRMWIMAGQIGKWLREVHSNDRHKLSASSPKLKYAAAQRNNEYSGVYPPTPRWPSVRDRLEGRVVVGWRGVGERGLLYRRRARRGPRAAVPHVAPPGERQHHGSGPVVRVDVQGSVAPWEARRRTIAAPIPRLPPVTSSLCFCLCRRAGCAEVVDRPLVSYND
jgi:hypothetical protein